jgi:hypothetical protein
MSQSHEYSRREAQCPHLRAGKQDTRTRREPREWSLLGAPDRAVAGTYGTLSGGGYPGPAVGGGSGLDPYVVALTNERLIAVRQGIRGNADRLAFDPDRNPSHLEITRRLPILGAWTRFVFHDRELKLLVGRRSTKELKRMQDTLEA